MSPMPRRRCSWKKASRHEQPSSRTSPRQLACTPSAAANKNPRTTPWACPIWRCQQLVETDVLTRVDLMPCSCALRLVRGCGEHVQMRSTRILRLDRRPAPTLNAGHSGTSRPPRGEQAGSFVMPLPRAFGLRRVGCLARSVDHLSAAPVPAGQPLARGARPALVGRAASMSAVDPWSDAGGMRHGTPSMALKVRPAPRPERLLAAATTRGRRRATR